VALFTVYRFRAWDTGNDQYSESGRWDTAEAIERVNGEVISEGVEIDTARRGSEVDGMTELGFDANQPPHSGFQTNVKR